MSVKITSTGGISALGGLSATQAPSYFGCTVGIGTYPTEANLEICSALNQQHLYIQGANDSVTALARLKTISSGSVLLLETATTSDSRDILKAKNSSGTVLNLQADGMLGVGTEHPNKLLTVAGEVSSSGGLSAKGGIRIPDEKYASFGDSQDMLIYHGSGNNWVTTPAGGNLMLQSNGLALRSLAQENYLNATANASVDLYYDNSKKFGTTSTGTVTYGALSTGALSASGGLSARGGICIPDGKEATFGDASDLRIYHNGSNSYVRNTHTGDFFIRTDDASSSLVLAHGAEKSFLSVAGGRAELRYDDSKKFETTSDGTKTTGAICGTGNLNIDGNSTLMGNLSVRGAVTCIDTRIETTSAVEVQNAGTGPAILANQLGSQPVVDFQDDGTSAFYIEDGGNVGINTSDPNETLTVVGDISATECFRFPGGLNLKQGTNSSLQVTNGSGYVQIGPQNTSWSHFSTDRNRFYFNKCIVVDTGVFKSYDEDLVIGGNETGTACDVIIKTDDTDRIHIEAAGNVGIGEAVPNQKFTVAGNISASGGLSAKGKSYFNDCVGIGVANPDQLLEVGGNIRIPNQGKIVFGSAGTSPSDYLELYDVGTSGSLLKLVQDGSDRFTIEGVSGDVCVTGSLSAGSGCHVSVANSSNGGFISGGRDLADVFATSSGNIDGSGTTCHVPYFSDANTIASSCTYFNSSTLTNRGAISGSVFCTDGNVFAACGRFSNDVCIGGNELFFANDAASAYIRAADTLYIESDYDADDTDKHIIFQTGAKQRARITTHGLSSSGGLSAAGSYGATNYFAGNVGIGTNRPDAWLTVSRDNDNSGNQFFVADTEGASAAVRTYTHGGSPAGLILNHYYAVAGSSNEYMRYADIVANISNGAGTTMRFITKNAANTYSTTVIDNNGNLTVSGNISALGSLSAGLGEHVAVCNSSYGGFISGGRDLADIFETCSSSVDGSGTKFKIPQWTDADTIGDSVISAIDTGITIDGCVGVRVTDPTSPLHVEGPFTISRTGVEAHKSTIDMDGNFRFAAHSGYSLTFHTDETDVGNTEIVRFRNDTGSVGIGNTEAGQKLTVSGNVSACGGLSATQKNSYFACNVGIGTNTPQKALEISAAGTSGGGVMRLASTGETSAGDAAGTIQFYNGDTTDYTPGVFGIIRGVAGPSGGEGHLQFLTDMPSEGADASTVAMQIHSNASVGIGSTSPNEKLTVAGNISACGDVCIGDDLVVNGESITVCGAAAMLKFCDTTDTDDMYMTFANAGTTYGCIGYLGATDFDICTNNRDIGLLPGTANVGIGNTAPTEKLTINGNLTASGGLSATNNITIGRPGTTGRSELVIKGKGNSSGDHVGMVAFKSYAEGDPLASIKAIRHSGDDTGCMAFATSDSERMRIDNNGCVGIGTTAPTKKLTVMGAITACGDVRTQCGTIEGKLIYARNCFAGTLFTAQYISNLGEACIMSGCYGCIRLGSSQGTKGVVISANNVSEAKVAIGVSSQVGFSDNDAALTVNGNISACGGLSATNGTHYFAGGSTGFGVQRPTAGTVTFADNCSIRMGSGGDMRMYHNGTNNFFESHNGDITFYNYDHANDIIFCAENSSGTAGNYIHIDSSADCTIFGKNTRHSDSVNAYFGSGGDLQIQNDSADSIIQENTRHLCIKNVASNGDVCVVNTNGGQTVVQSNLSAQGGLSAIPTGSEWVNLGAKVGISNDTNHFDLNDADNEAGLHIKSKGDVALILEADTDNSGESDNPKIKLIQDGGGVEGNIYVKGNAATSNRIHANSFVMGNTDNYGVAIIDSNYSYINIEADPVRSASNVGIHTMYPNEKLTVNGNISARGGLSAANIANVYGSANNYFAGCVGIGTNRPIKELTVIGDLSASDCIRGHVEVRSAAICGTTTVCGATVCGTSYVYSPQICGTTTVSGPAVCGTTSVCGPAICGTTSVCAPLVCGTNCVTTSCMIATGCTIACASNYYIDNGGYSFNFGQGTACHQLMYYGDMYYCNIAGHVKFDQDATDKDIIFCGDKGSGKYTFVTMDMSDSILDVQGPVKQQTAINTQTGTTYTLVLADHAKLITLNNGSAITLTVPPNSSVAFPTGTEITLTQLGAGQVTIAAGSGVTLYAADSELKTRVQYSSAVLTKIASDTWIVAGDLTA